MRPWEEAIIEFTEKVELDPDFSQIHLYMFLEQGLNPLLEEYYQLKRASDELVEANLQIFKQVINNPNHKMKNSRFYNALSSVMKLTSDPKGVQ